MNPTKPILQVVKIGGNVIDNPKALADFLRLFASLDGPKVLIHGGGKIATQLAKDMGIESKMIDGRRVTDEASLRIVTMVYAGWINKSIVATLQAEGCTSLGLSGPDGGMVRAKKRNPIPVDYGFVGDIEAVNGKALAQLIEAGYAPIFAPITADASGQLLNTNADTMAQAIAIALSDFFQVNLVYCFEKPGVLRDPQDDHSVIPSINASYFEELKANGTVTAGMIPKLENALKAISKGVHLVRLCLADHLMNENLGTNILP